MITLVDTSLWIDFLRPQSSVGLKRFVAPYLTNKTAHVAEPIVFELLRNALPAQLPFLTQQFGLLPLLSTPGDLWQKASQLGQACRRRGHTAGALDLLIGVIARKHGAVLVTLDEHFKDIGEAGSFRVELLLRPGA